MYLLSFLILMGASTDPATLDSLSSRLRETQTLIEDLEARQVNTSEVLIAIHEHLETARDYYNRLAEREAEIVHRIQRVDRSRASKDSTRAGLVQNLERYIFFMYSHRRFSRPAAVFVQGGLGRYLRRQAYLDFLAQRAAVLVERLSHSRDSLSAYRDSLQILQNDVHRLRERMGEIQERIYRQEEKQARYRQELEAEIAAAEDAASRMEAERRRLSALVAQLRVTESSSGSAPIIDPDAGSFFELNRGSIPWPSRGDVVRYFGIETHPVYGTETVSDGIRVSTNPGAEINAPMDGKVLYANEFLSLGNMVVIDHQDGFYTVYGYLGDMFVGAEEKIGKGRSVGSAGPLPGGRPGYYFEIRRGGEPVDPLQYLE